MPDLAPLPETPDIPEKLFLRIGEVSALVGVEPYVLRYWETEFPALAPKKTKSAAGGHRLYRRKDVELLLRIKHLLYEQRFTIEGARQLLQSEPKRPEPSDHQQALFPNDGALPMIRKELAEILSLLK
jgi:DNA-binding transcriptional MerR regulator